MQEVVIITPGLEQDYLVVAEGIILISLKYALELAED